MQLTRNTCFTARRRVRYNRRLDHSSAAERPSGQPFENQRQGEQPARNPEDVVNGEQRGLLRDHVVELAESLAVAQSRLTKQIQRLGRLRRVRRDAFNQLGVVQGFAALPEGCRSRKYVSRSSRRQSFIIMMQATNFRKGYDLSQTRRLQRRKRVIPN